MAAVGEGVEAERAGYESELTWLSTRELAGLIRSGQVSAREALADHYARIDAVNPAINAVVTRDDERAFALAEAADAAHARGESLGPLHGVPLTHKDSIDVAGLRTTLGSRIFLDNVAETDALIVARLRAAGSIPSGKTNVPEFSAGSHTVNDVFGATRNPYDPTKSASGSSGGAAAAIAAGIQGAGDGTDMGGSLRTPASFNNLVGLRPSAGRIPRVPPSDPWMWLAQPGFMARTVSDVALMMSVAAGPDPRAEVNLPEAGAVFDRAEFGGSTGPGSAVGSVARSVVGPVLDSRPEPGSALVGARVGYSADLGGLLPVEPEVATIVTAAVARMAGAGARVDDVIPALADADEVFHVTRAYDFAADYAETLRAHRSVMKSSVVWNTEIGLNLSVEDLLSAAAARVRLAVSVREYFEHHDLLVLTASQVAPFDVGIEYPAQIDGQPMVDYLQWMRAATIISATGCPSISVPAGFTAAGLPVGIQLVAAPGRDVELLLAALACEELAPHHLTRPSL